MLYSTGDFETLNLEETARDMHMVRGEGPWGRGRGWGRACRGRGRVTAVDVRKHTCIARCRCSCGGSMG